ncbi:MAG: GerMN domain-containing protein [Treponema sp.]|nr:GerMN domain-containing protein [Treponema sp.]
MAIIFWLAFFIIITSIFFINRETIKKNSDILAQRLNLPRLALPKGAADKPAEPAGAPGEDAPASGSSGNEASPSAGPPRPAEPARPAPGDSAAKPPAEKTAQPSAAQPAPSPKAEPAKPAQPAETKPAAQPARSEKPAETRERSIYFTRIDKDGTILRTKVSRKIAVSDSPMLDSLNALLLGPTAEEQRRGLMSLIPKGARILSATVRGNTAYISFSEDFQYNTYGVEGYAAQLKQIVWTVTEFPNINDVQILVEGRRVDYLGEGIWIGSPVNRDSI